MKTILAAFAFVAVAASPAFADCAGDLAKIDEAMKTAQLDEAKKTQAMGLVDTAKAANDKGDAAACETATKEVLALLGM
ncbi:MAG: hypothetical protein HC855_04350 [Rhizobiales bacterium]|nr:hypothetical protein [Hyphomicrobiales bacterium]